MKAYELTSWLEKKYPSDAAEDWDNVGLLAGDDTNEISHVFLALDLTIEDGADMIITHHPMIFSGIKKINNHSFTGRKILTLIQKGIVYYAMHTNYDVLGMADLSADYTKMHDTTVLSITEEREGEVQGFGRVGKLPREMTLREYAQLVKESLKLNDVKVYGNLDSMVKCAAVCTGSGKSMIKDVIKAGADVYVTGDIDHHTGIDTVAQGLALIDAGHYGTEYVFIPYLFTISKKHLSTFLLGYTIIGTILLSISPCTNFKQEIVAPPIIVLCKINNNFITTILT